jgi:hypothetical protein
MEEAVKTLSSHPFSHKFVIDFISSLMMGDKLLVDKNLRSFLYTAG